VVLNDFNFKKPKLDLASSSDCGRDGALEFYDYPGEYEEQRLGQDLAKLRAEEFEAHRTVGVGLSNSPRLAPGRKFDLLGHPAGLDDSYLVTSVTHQGKQAISRTTTGGNGRTGDPTANRALTEWLYHAGQVSRDIASVAEASGGNPLGALAIPKPPRRHLQHEHRGSRRPGL
jgi:uncharacterized protein involved in type VI secretion and phage assembly